MILHDNHRYWQHRRQAGLWISLCLCVLGLAPAGYGQTDNPNKLISRLTDKKATVRESAVEALVKIGTPAVEPLIAALKHPGAGVRASAAEALGKINDPRAVEPLAAALKDPDFQVKWQAGDALTKAGTPAVELLIGAMKDPDAQVRSNATRALGPINDPRSVEPMITSLKDSIAGGKIFAAHALGETNDPRAVSALVAALREHDKEVVTAAYYFFIRRGEPGSEDVLIEGLNWIDNYKMVEDFLNCGNAKLEAAARAWAGRHGYRTTQTTSSGGRVKWGSAQ